MFISRTRALLIGLMVITHAYGMDKKPADAPNANANAAADNVPTVVSGAAPDTKSRAEQDKDYQDMLHLDLWLALKGLPSISELRKKTSDRTYA